MNYILSSLIFIPILTVLLILCLPARLQNGIRLLSLLATAAQLILAVWLFWSFQPISGTGAQTYQYVEQVNWIHLNLQSLGQLQIQYYLGVDGISLSMVLLTGIIGFIGVVLNRNRQRQKLTEGVPTQMIFFFKLLYVLGS